MSRGQGDPAPRPVKIVPPDGPGSELKRLLAELGIPACGQCAAFAARMNVWGVEGCEARREEILTHLRGQAAKLDWWARARTGALAVLGGLPLTAEGLLDEALRRAKEER